MKNGPDLLFYASISLFLIELQEYQATSISQTCVTITDLISSQFHYILQVKDFNITSCPQQDLILVLLAPSTCCSPLMLFRIFQIVGICVELTVFGVCICPVKAIAEQWSSVVWWHPTWTMWLGFRLHPGSNSTGHETEIQKAETRSPEIMRSQGFTHSFSPSSFANLQGQ